MSRVLQCITAVVAYLPPSLCVVMAYLALRDDAVGWGWFLFCGLLLHWSTEGRQCK